MKNNIDDLKAREKFQNRIIKGMQGPGSDTWGLDDTEEIISDYPLIRYFTGILFPDSKICKTQEEEDLAEVENETSDDIADNESLEQENKDEILKDEELQESKEEEIVNQKTFFPTNIGLTVCVENTKNELDVEFNFGLYHQAKLHERKIAISEEGYNSFFYEKLPFQLPFKEKLKYENGFMFLSKDLDGFAGGKGEVRSGDFKGFDDFKRKDNLIDSNAKYFIETLSKLIDRPRFTWKRTQMQHQCKIPINIEKHQEIPLPDKAYKDLSVSFYTKIYSHKGQRYVKIQLVNTSTKHPKNKFSNKKESLNRKSIFQSSIKVISNNFLPYKTHYERFPFDEEAEKLNFIYRDVKSFAIGHNCSAIWNDDIKPSEIQTTFMPHSNIKDVKNNFNDKNDDKLNQALNIKSLSTFGNSKETVLENLYYFVGLYKQWIDDQNLSKQDLAQNDFSICEKIIAEQERNYKRLKENIELLKDDDVFFAFQLANTAMYIQLLTSNDVDFGKYEKEYSELTNDVNYNSLSFFKNYNAEERVRDGKIKFAPQYRPFQLAFLLLNIDGIVDESSSSRKEIVDLIWFPTGGGKTEAYLAVTALTIIWRRFKNDVGYGGTTVIMRYTLRLLTAQQFERASRLISALEFLRKQNEFSDILKTEPITIGMWVGKASTPNTKEAAKRIYDNIENESSKKKGNPQEKNTFQIHSCPWCGTKLISKIDDEWDYGFNYSPKKGFSINCLNEKCAFNSRLPIQVVDEELYENPPTLLFGTVDKFAQLAWQDNGYKFFNTHSAELLPPDLIIQDELHLLSGPLGSITGIYENVIELLATKGDRMPKIIASTATTRNTDKQIAALYGNRKVNIFPPSGVKQSDSFFAREETQKSKRRYLGFMPTGKTNVDTQLQLLAHLFVARLEVFLDNETKGSANNYWTLVAYYNSLKDVGRTNNKVGDEVTTFTGALQHRLAAIFPNNIDEYKYNYLGIYSRTKELTSRIASEKIKETLGEIEKEFSNKSFTEDDKGRKYLNDVVDLVLATNMISVGIDISRLNIMLLNGIPSNTAEYIQASSRVGRDTFGLVLTLCNPMRAREKSYFEHFYSFHQSFYKSVEPLSVTPFTENTIDKMAATIFATYIRQYHPGELNRNNQAKYFTKDKSKKLLDFIKKRYGKTEGYELFENRIKELSNDWFDRIENSSLCKYKDELLVRPDEKEVDELWTTMQSMRDVDTTTFIKVKERK